MQKALLIRRVAAAKTRPMGGDPRRYCPASTKACRTDDPAPFQPLFEPPAAPLPARAQSGRKRQGPARASPHAQCSRPVQRARAAASAAGSSACAPAACAARIAFFASGILISPRAQAPARASAWRGRESAGRRASKKSTYNAAQSSAQATSVRCVCDSISAR